ncbi:MAG: hypothetical protein COA74_15375 [Gammaproteobacteria bacterium]|nr:MAG: hypothetical protein COA74_15375 [Gammaproteobacteria bacterium]
MQVLDLVYSSFKYVTLLVIFISLFSCGAGGDSSSTDDGVELNPDFSDLQPYLPNGPYAAQLKNCVSIVNIPDSCSLNQLPPIGLDNSTPTIDDILNHLVVSHMWMGDRMRDLLEMMPADILLLLRSSTAIVIDADIRPAYFWQLTGAIYIDPALLWTTNEEKETIDPTEDFRSNFGDELQFKRLWRYIINNDFAWTSYSLTGIEERTNADNLVLTTWLFYHELAHANDCLPSSELDNLARGDSYYENFLTIRNSGKCIQDRLTALYPLNSGIWHSLANVLYKGDDATNQQKTYSAEFVAAEFITDVASDTYSYSSLWEDTAMLFEEILMKKNFNADRDLVFVDFYDTFTCSEVLVKWGQRGRLGDSDVIERARFIVGELLPEIDFTELFANQPAPFNIPLDVSYCITDYSSQNAGKHQQSTKAMQVRLQNQHKID